MIVLMLFVTWALVAVIRSQFGLPWNHFLTGSALFVCSFFIKNVEQVRFKPSKRFGPWVCLGYILSCFLLFILLGKMSELPLALEDLVQQNFYLLLFTSIFAPIYEEVFFRGTLLNYQKETLSRSGIAIYINGLTFWLFHAPLNYSIWKTALSIGALPIGPGPFLLGIVCATIAYLDKSIFWAIVFHILANSMGPFWMRLIEDQKIFQLFYN